VSHTLTPSPRELADLELLLDGAYAPLTGFPTASEVRAGRLADGTRWPLPVTLAVPDAVQPDDVVTLTDPEGAPLAELQVTEVSPAEGRRYAAGAVTRLRKAEFGAFRSLHRQAADVAQTLAGRPSLAYITAGPLLRTEIAELNANAERLGARIVLFPATGNPEQTTAFRLSPDTIVKAALAARRELPDDTLVVPSPLSNVDSPWLLETVARNYGASHQYVPGSSAEPENETRIVPGTDTRDQHAKLARLLDDGADLPTDLVTAEIARILQSARPPRHRRGVVVFFTGLSGSGKSTVARGLADALAEVSDRTVTLLDGDVVRRLLSAGLTFSRADRDLNIARIGFVAAEAARHGGIVLCAPIAPYKAARTEVRQRVSQVGDFLLVHVATPLEVCEARDRKGLYAKARAGIIPEFTGISDPYEIPDDAELTLDTSTESTVESVGQVLQLLTSMGYVDSISRITR
jgi:sulfate adenylyltransferase